MGNGHKTDLCLCVHGSDDCQHRALVYGFVVCCTDPVHCTWSEWSEVNCVAAGDITRTRTRIGPYYGGVDCVGDDTVMVHCGKLLL
jgi:hypothetical protein